MVVAFDLVSNKRKLKGNATTSKVMAYVRTREKVVDFIFFRIRTQSVIETKIMLERVEMEEVREFQVLWSNFVLWSK